MWLRLVTWKNYTFFQSRGDVDSSKLPVYVNFTEVEPSRYCTQVKIEFQTISSLILFIIENFKLELK